MHALPIVRRAGSAVVLVGYAAAHGLLSCQTDPIQKVQCTNIPEHGCPKTGADACADPSCKAVYACLPDQTWEYVKDCPNFDGGTSMLRDASDMSDAQPLPDGNNSVAGCPSLQLPDCARDVALACGADCCGCEDLFICEDRTWLLWGQCRQGRLDPTSAGPVRAR